MSPDKLSGFFDSLDALPQGDIDLMEDEMRLEHGTFTSRLRHLIADQRTLCSNLLRLRSPLAYGATLIEEDPSLVVRGAEQIPDVQTYRFPSYYTASMTGVNDLRRFGGGEHLVALGKLFPDRPFPQTESPIWIPGTHVAKTVSVPPRPGKKRFLTRLESTAKLYDPSQDLSYEAPVSTRAGFIPAMVIRMKPLFVR